MQELVDLKEDVEMPTDDTLDEEYIKNNTCPSCGIKYVNHLGLIGTCGKIQRIKANLEILREIYYLPEYKPKNITDKNIVKTIQDCLDIIG